MQSFLEFHTRKQTYIVSPSPESVKSVFRTHGIKASDLRFSTALQRKQLTKDLFLLAVQDELENHRMGKKAASPLAILARNIIA